MKNEREMIEFIAEKIMRFQVYGDDWIDDENAYFSKWEWNPYKNTNHAFELLNKLIKYGFKPHLTYYNGWHCTLTREERAETFVESRIDETTIGTYSENEAICQAAIRVADDIERFIEQKKAPAELSQEAEYNLQRLDVINSLEYGWNGNSAESFPNELINLCKDYVKALDIQPGVFPTAANAIQFEYEKQNGDYLEFEIRLNEIEVFTIRNGEEREFVISTIDEIKNIVDEFYKEED